MEKQVSMIEKNLTPEQLQKIVKQKHLTLNAGIDRVIDKENKMVWQPYVCLSSPSFDYVKTYEKNAESAFNQMKLRLFSGEIIDTGRGKKFQLTCANDGVKLVAV